MLLDGLIYWIIF